MYNRNPERFPARTVPQAKRSKSLNGRAIAMFRAAKRSALEIDPAGKAIVYDPPPDWAATANGWDTRGC
jgi:hypothetical protein